MNPSSLARREREIPSLQHQITNKLQCLKPEACACARCEFCVRNDERGDAARRRAVVGTRGRAELDEANGLAILSR
jgi:hypothetical protein